MVNNPRRAAAIFGALSDPTRLRILARLADEGEGQVTELARPFRVSLPAISKHLRVLERARLIRRRRNGRIHVIRARPEGLKPVREWIKHYVAGWETSFDMLDRLLKNEEREDTVR